MNRVLLRSAAFIRAARKFIKRQPQSATDLEAAIQLLSADAFDPRLRTHKLSGELTGSWACSAGCDLRFVFSFAMHEGNEAILLETVGTHEDVY